MRAPQISLHHPLLEQDSYARDIVNELQPKRLLPPVVAARVRDIDGQTCHTQDIEESNWPVREFDFPIHDNSHLHIEVFYGVAEVSEAFVRVKDLPWPKNSQPLFLPVVLYPRNAPDELHQLTPTWQRGAIREPANRNKYFLLISVSPPGSLTTIDIERLNNSYAPQPIICTPLKVDPNDREIIHPPNAIIGNDLANSRGPRSNYHKNGVASGSKERPVGRISASPYSKRIDDTPEKFFTDKANRRAKHDIDSPDASLMIEMSPSPEGNPSQARELRAAEVAYDLEQSFDDVQRWGCAPTLSPRSDGCSKGGSKGGEARGKGKGHVERGPERFDLDAGDDLVESDAVDGQVEASSKVEYGWGSAAEAVDHGWGSAAEAVDQGWGLPVRDANGDGWGQQSVADPARCAPAAVSCTNTEVQTDGAIGKDLDPLVAAMIEELEKRNLIRTRECAEGHEFTKDLLQDIEKFKAERDEAIAETSQALSELRKRQDDLKNLRILKEDIQSQLKNERDSRREFHDFYKEKIKEVEGLRTRDLLNYDAYHTPGGAREEIEKLRKQIDSLEKQLEAEKSKPDHGKELKQLNEQVAQLQEELKEARQEQAPAPPQRQRLESTSSIKTVDELQEQIEYLEERNQTLEQQYMKNLAYDATISEEQIELRHKAAIEALENQMLSLKEDRTTDIAALEADIQRMEEQHSSEMSQKDARSQNLERENEGVEALKADLQRLQEAVCALTCQKSELEAKFDIKDDKRTLVAYFIFSKSQFIFNYFIQLRNESRTDSNIFSCSFVCVSSALTVINYFSNFI